MGKMNDKITVADVALELFRLATELEKYASHPNMLDDEKERHAAKRSSAKAIALVVAYIKQQAALAKAEEASRHG